MELDGPLVAALPMYDWPEERAATDAQWRRYRDALRAAGVPAPDALARSNADLPPVAGGIRDAGARLVAFDPADLPPRSLHLDALWRHPSLLLAQTCWGPLELGLSAHVQVLAQPDYGAFPGGRGIRYRSALVVPGDPSDDLAPPRDDGAALDVSALRGLRLARNAPHSMSGALALARDLAAAGALAREQDFESFWAAVLDTGRHRRSLAAVAAGRADVAAIDCRSLALARRHEPFAARVRVAGWTALREGLPLIASRRLHPALLARVRSALATCPDLFVADAPGSG